jgi:3'(2'), 5'-bisphosphate nucleotidase
VTAADHASEAIILEGLRRLTPGVPIVAEEQVAGGEKHNLEAGAPFWCVDPLDGTRDFTDGFDDYVVCIGLIDQGYPILGVLFAPATNTAWTGAHGQAFRIRDNKREPISARPVPSDGLKAFISRSNRDGARLDDYLAEAGALDRMVVGSALKFALIAEGRGDLYARFGRTHEWDTAAGQAVLEAAGGSVLTENGERLPYGKPGFTNGPFFVRGKT